MNSTDDVTWWYVSTPGFTCAIATDEEDVIRQTPPILRRFVGQPRSNLTSWIQDSPRLNRAWVIEQLPAGDPRSRV